MSQPVQADATIGRLRRLLDARVGEEGLLVAMSGGVDSCTLAWVAHDVLGDGMLAVTLDAESSADAEVDAAVRFAREHGIPHRVVEHSELSDPDYVENTPLRCYHCRDGMTDALAEIADDEGLEHVAMGYLPDDAMDHTPGRVAAAESGAWFPYVDAGLDKAAVRALAEEIGLDVADRPSNACLSSRIPYGSEVTREKLAQVEAAERIVREALGVEQVRVRHHGDVARIEVAPEHREAMLAEAETITAEIEALGFTWVAMDLLGYRTGAMNEVLDGAPPEQPAPGAGQKGS